MELVSVVWVWVWRIFVGGWVGKIRAHAAGACRAWHPSWWWYIRHGPRPLQPAACHTLLPTAATPNASDRPGGLSKTPPKITRAASHMATVPHTRGGVQPTRNDQMAPLPAAATDQLNAPALCACARDPQAPSRAGRAAPGSSRPPPRPGCGGGARALQAAVVERKDPRTRGSGRLKNFNQVVRRLQQHSSEMKPAATPGSRALARPTARAAGKPRPFLLLELGGALPCFLQIRSLDEEQTNGSTLEERVWDR